MSISSNKSATLQQRFGFQDHELKTPEHDRIMLWLDAHVDAWILGRISLGWNKEKVERMASEMSDLVKDSVGQWAPGDLPPRTVSIVSKVWESPVMSGKYMVGFIDMKVDVKQSALTYTIPRRSQEFPEWSAYLTDWFYLFEVKPSIPSVGEVIRQIRMYKQYQPGTYVVVSPDDRCAVTLKGQGIEFLKAAL